VQQQIKLEFGAQSQGDERQSTSNYFAAVHESAVDAVDGSSTGTRP